MKAFPVLKDYSLCGFFHCHNIVSFVINQLMESPMESRKSYFIDIVNHLPL